LTKGNPSAYQYDAVSGISGGAVNAALFASYQKGDEEAASARLEQFWLDAASNSLYKNWFGGILQGLTLEGGLYNSAPLKDFLADQTKDISKMERDVDLGIVDVLDGLYKDFSQ
jgi:predicted acylesterase/phospholipase RssA